MYSAITTTSPAFSRVTVPVGSTRAASSSLTVKRRQMGHIALGAIGESGLDPNRQ